jgi:hypothetical protein
VRCVCLLLQYLIQSCSRGGGALCVRGKVCFSKVISARTGPKFMQGMQRCTRLLLLLSAAVMRLPHALPAEVRRYTPAPQRTHGAQSMCVLGVLVRSTSVHTLWESDVCRFCGACGGDCCCCHATLTTQENLAGAGSLQCHPLLPVHVGSFVTGAHSGGSASHGGLPVSVPALRLKGGYAPARQPDPKRIAQRRALLESLRQSAWEEQQIAPEQNVADELLRQQAAANLPEGEAQMMTGNELAGGQEHGHNCEPDSSMEEEQNIFVRATSIIDPVYEEEYQQMREEALAKGETPPPPKVYHAAYWTEAVHPRAPPPTYPALPGASSLLPHHTQDSTHGTHSVQNKARSKTCMR